MRTETPQITWLAYSGFVGPNGWHFIGSIGRSLVAAISEQHVDLAHLEAGELDIEINIESEQLKLFGEDVLVPAGDLGQPVICDHIGADLRLREPFDANHGNRV